MSKIIANTNTFTLSKDYIMAWTGTIYPNNIEIYWIYLNKNKLTNCSFTSKNDKGVTKEEFDSIKFADFHDKSLLNKIKDECFPYIATLVKLDGIYSSTTAKIFINIPLSELDRVGHDYSFKETENQT